MKTQNFFIRFLRRLFWRVWLWFLWLSSLLIILITLFLTTLQHNPAKIEQWASEVLEQPVTIENITLFWNEGQPRIALQQLHLLDSSAEQTVVEIAVAEIVLDIWASLSNNQIMTHHINVSGSQFALERHHDGTITLVGFSQQPSSDNNVFLPWLLQQPKIDFHATTLTWREAKKQPLAFSELQLTLERQIHRHRVTGRVELPSQSIQGVQAKAISFNSWLNFQPLTATGQFTLEQVQLVSSPAAKNAEESLQGQFEITQHKNGRWQIALKQYLINQNQQLWLPNEIQVQIAPSPHSPAITTQASKNAVKLNGYIRRLPLAQLQEKLPSGLLETFNPELQSILMTMQGTLHEIQWKYAPNDWHLRTRFTSLTLPPKGQIPGIRGLSGQLDFKPNQGILAFNQTTLVTLNLPNLYSQPILLDQIKGQIHWQRNQQQWRLTTQNFQMTDKSTNITLRVEAQAEIPSNKGIPKSQLLVTLPNSQLSQWQTYLPEQRFPNLAEQFNKVQLSGQLSDAQLFIKTYGEKTQVKFNGRVDNVSVHLFEELESPGAWGRAPIPALAINNLSGYLEIGADKGTIEIEQTAITINLPSRYSHPLSLTHLSGKLNWRRITAQQWQITTKNLQAIDENQMTVQMTGNLKLHVKEKVPVHDLVFTVKNGPLSKLIYYLPDKNFSETVHELREAQLAGELSQGQIIVKGKGKNTQVEFIGQIKNASFNLNRKNATHPIQTRVHSLSGQLNVQPDKNKGHFFIEQATVTVHKPDLYSHPLSWTQLTGKLSWQRNQQNWSIFSKKLQAYDNKMKWTVKGHINIPHQEEIPYSDLLVELEDGPLSQIASYLPDKKISGVVDWLNEAILAGQVDHAVMKLQGPIDALFEPKTHHFSIKAKINQVRINYANGWPILTNGKANVEIQQDRLTVTTFKGQVFNSQVRHLVAEIPDIFQKTLLLNLDINTHGQISDGLRFIQQSPLRENIDLGNREFDGLMDLQLNLALPFSEEPANVQGTITLKQTTFRNKDYNLTLTDVNGPLNFHNDQLSANNMRGKLFGKPVSFSVHRTTDKIIAQMTGFGDPQLFSQQLRELGPEFAKLPLTTYLSGTTRWKARLEAPNEPRAGNDETHFHFEADLLGMDINLPAPLSKKASQWLPFTVSLRIPVERGQEKGELLEFKAKLCTAGESLEFKAKLCTAGQSFALDSNRGILLQIGYGNRLNGLFHLNKMGLERGSVVLGNTPAQLPKQALFHIEGHTSHLSITAWLNQLNQSNEKRATNDSQVPISKSPFPMPILMDVYFYRFEALGQTFSNIAIQAEYAKSRWQAAITGPKIEGQMKFFQTLTPTLSQRERETALTPTLSQREREPALYLDFKKLMLTTQSTKQPSANKPKTSTEAPPDPRSLPSLSFHCDKMMIDEMNFGQVKLHTKPNYDGLTMTLEAQATGFHLQASGQWRYVVQRHQTVLQATLNTEKIDLMLQQLGLKQPPIVGKQGQLTLNTYWQDAPYRFQLSKTTGTLSLAIMEGNLVDIEPGPIGRLFGLFDVYTLPRRLALDFSDVFYQGFGFNAIAGVFFLKNGIADTKHFILQAPSARVEISGTTNLIKQTYQQTITVFPQISNPLPIAGALAGGLGGGLAALVIQQLLQAELEQVLKFQYQMTGPWDKPNVAPN
jgi:uncharacterized protein YhdP